MIAAACKTKDKCGHIYHIPDEQMDGFPSSDGVPDELLTDDNLHTILTPGGSYERDVVMVDQEKGSVAAARFIFTHFR